MLIDDYTLIQPIGKGAFGEVYLTSKQGSKEKYATKKIEKKRFTANPRAKKYLDNEINILKIIDHPNIVKLFTIKETSNFMYIITEYCNGGDLSKCLEDYQNKHNKSFPEVIVQYLMRQIISALKYLHNKKILHRDLKLDNILVCFDNEEDRRKKNMLKAKVKIIDFGFARYLKNEELAFSTLGSPINMDPIILRKLNKLDYSNEFGYDEKADIWSLGTLTYELLVGKCTFEAESMNDLVKRVEKGDYLLPTSLSKEAVSFLNSMLQYDIKNRLTTTELSQHSFLVKNISQFHPINLLEIKKHVKGQNIKLNTKFNNQSIWDVFGKGSVFLVGVGNEGMILEEEKEKEKEKEKNKNKNNNYVKPKKPIDNESKNPVNPIKRVKSKKYLNEEALKEEFMNVFELINDDFINVEPKLIPIIPGDDPNVIIKPTEFFDDN